MRIVIQAENEAEELAFGRGITTEDGKPARLKEVAINDVREYAMAGVYIEDGLVPRFFERWSYVPRSWFIIGLIHAMHEKIKLQLSRASDGPQ